MKNIKKEIIILIGFNFFIILLLTLLELNMSIFIIYFILFLISFFIILLNINKRILNIVFMLFLIVLTINLLSTISSSYIFKYNLGSMLGANDEAYFYYESKKIGQSFIDNQSRYYSPIDSKLYINSLGMLSYLALILDEYSPLIIKIFSTFIGSFIPIYIFLIYKKIDIKNCNKISLLTGVFPILIYYSSIGVRDIAIALLTVMFFYYLFDKKHRYNLNEIKVIFIIATSYFFRSEHAIFLIGVYLLYRVYISYNSKNYSYLFILIFFIFCFFILNYNLMVKNTVEHLVKLRKSYYNIFVHSSNKNSIGMKLFLLPFPLNYLTRFAFTLLGVFPPLKVMDSVFVRGATYVSQRVNLIYKSKINLSIGRYMYSIGFINWYMLLPYLIYGTLKCKTLFNNIKLNFMIVISMVYVFLISIITSEPGRIVPFYPILVSFSYAVLYNINRKTIIILSLLNLLFFIMITLIYLGI